MALLDRVLDWVKSSPWRCKAPPALLPLLPQITTSPWSSDAGSGWRA